MRETTGLDLLTRLSEWAAAQADQEDLPRKLRGAFRMFSMSCDHLRDALLSVKVTALPFVLIERIER